MKNLKKLLALILAVTLSLALAAPLTASAVVADAELFELRPYYEESGNCRLEIWARNSGVGNTYFADRAFRLNSVSFMLTISDTSVVTTTSGADGTLTAVGAVPLDRMGTAEEVQYLWYRTAAQTGSDVYLGSITLASPPVYATIAPSVEMTVESCIVDQVATAAYGTSVTLWSDRFPHFTVERYSHDTVTITGANVQNQMIAVLIGTDLVERKTVTSQSVILTPDWDHNVYQTLTIEDGQWRAYEVLLIDMSDMTVVMRASADLMMVGIYETSPSNLAVCG